MPQPSREKGDWTGYFIRDCCKYLICGVVSGLAVVAQRKVVAGKIEMINGREGRGKRWDSGA